MASLIRFNTFFINVHFRYILVHHGFGLVIKGSSNLNFFNILYWLLNTFLVLFIFLSMPLAKVSLRFVLKLTKNFR